jgi:hypothetical protein
MSISRRSLLQYTGVSCALALLAPVVNGAPTWRLYEVRDNVAQPRFRPGARVVADAAIDSFTGDGLYLYPAWGQPRLYSVQATGGLLEFRNPGSGQLLWRQSAGFDARFAGKIVDSVASAELAATFPALAVPALPA